MTDNQDQKNYVDVVKLDVCCKRRETLKLIGIEVKESPLSSLDPSSGSVTSKKQVSIVGHSKVNGSRSLDSRSLRPDGKVIPKGILRCKDTDAEREGHRAVLCHRVNENKVKENELGRTTGVVVDNTLDRRNSAATLTRKEGAGGLENATCSAHGTKSRPATGSLDFRTGWGPVKATKVSPPRMKRRKKKSQSLNAPKPETRQSRLATLLVNQLSTDPETKVTVRRRSPPKPSGENEQVSWSKPSGVSAKNSPEAVSEVLLCVDQVNREPERLIQIQSSVSTDDLAFRNRSAVVQSSPDFTSDDTDGGSKDSGYVTLEDLQAQLICRSASSSDEKETDFNGPSGGDSTKDIDGRTSEVGLTRKQSVIDDPDKGQPFQLKDSSLLQFTFTVKLDSSLMKRRQARRGSTVMEAEGDSGHRLVAPVVAGKVDVVVSELSSRDGAAAALRAAERFTEECDVVDGCSSGSRKLEFPQSNALGKTTKRDIEFQTNLGKSHLDRFTSESGTEPELMNNERRNPVSDVALKQLQSAGQMPDSLDMEKESRWKETGNDKQRIRSKHSTSFNISSKDTLDVEDSTEQSPLDATGPWDVGTYLRPVSSKGNDQTQTEDRKDSDSKSEAIHMSWQEVVAEAQTLGIPLNIPRQRRTRPSRLEWEDRRRSLTSCDSSGESETQEVDERSIPKSEIHRKSMKCSVASCTGQSVDQGAVLFKARKTLKELLKMRNPFGRAKKKKSKRQQRSQRDSCEAVPSSTGRACRHTKKQPRNEWVDEATQPPPTPKDIRPHHRSTDRSINGRSALNRLRSFDEVDCGTSTEIDEDTADQQDPTQETPPHQSSTRTKDYLASSLDNILCPSASLLSRRADFVQSLNELQSCGWYWGQMELEEAELKLSKKPDGTFLVRDSSDDRYILSLSFRSLNSTHHTRIEHYKGLFGFHSQMQLYGVATIVEFINKAMELSKDGRCVYYLRPRGPGLSPAPVRLLYPLSRFRCLHSLKHLCKFVIARHVRLDRIDRLPISPRLKEYLKGGGGATADPPL